MSSSLSARPALPPTVASLLAIDTSTEVLSVAVGCTVDGVAQQWLHQGAGGAQASNTLISCVLDLLAQAQLRLQDLDAICFGAGPGSFTGLRTACSVTQGLAFGADVPVLCVDTLLAVAEEARHTAQWTTPCTVTALLDARMDEVYAATYAWDGTQWATLQDSTLVRPEQMGAYLESLQRSSAGPTTALANAPCLLAGNVFAVYGARLALPAGPWTVQAPVPALPTAAAMLRLAPALLAAGQAVDAAHAMPSYIRDKVAQTTAERAAIKAAQAAPTTVSISAA